MDAWFQLHEKFCNLEFEELIKPAIEFAENGYFVHERLSYTWSNNIKRLQNSFAKSIFLNNKQPPLPGQKMHNLPLAQVLKVISKSDRIVSIHSEDEDIIKLRTKFIKQGNVHSHPEWRNVECAISSTRRVVKIAERYNKKIHVLHVTTKDEVDFLAMHKKNVTFETTPQHLTLYAPDCYDKLGTYAQMNPPLRGKEHYDRLWMAIKNNIVLI